MKSAVSYDTIATIEPSGNISAANAEHFKEQLLNTLADRASSVLLIDMKRVEFLDSAGLMVLIFAYHFARSLNRRVSLCSVAPSVRIIFELTQLDNLFEIFENCETFACVFNSY